MRITGLPFPVVVDGDVTRGDPATLSIGLTDPFDDQAFDQLRCVVVWWAQLGELGALGGCTVAPTATRATLSSLEPNARSLSPVWQFDALRVDPRAITLLANLAYACRHPVSQLRLTTTGTGSTTDLQPDHYPEPQTSLPFQLLGGPTQRTVELAVTFAQDLRPDLEPILVEAVQIWAMVGALGGFREPGPLLERPDLVPDDEPEVTLDQLTFVFRDYGMHEAAYDALLHMLAAFSDKHQRIVTVELS